MLPGVPTRAALPSLMLMFNIDCPFITMIWSLPSSLEPDGPSWKTILPYRYRTRARDFLLSGNTGGATLKTVRIVAL